MSTVKNAEKYRQAMEEYLNDNTLSMSHLANKYGFTRGLFSKYLKENGVQVSFKKDTKVHQKQEQAIKMYQEGKSVKQIAEELSISRKSLGLYFKENNVELRDKSTKIKESYTVNEDFFETIDTENKAYWLGFIYADGSINTSGQSYRLCIELSIVDFNHLKKFRRDVMSDAPIKQRKNRNTVSIQISSKKLVTDLISYGCIENKTYEGFIDKLDMSYDLSMAFLRGYLDGDGCISKNRPVITYTIHSKILVEYIRDLIEKHLLIKPSILMEKTYYRLVIQNKKSYEVFTDAIYGNANVYLDRKYELYHRKNMSTSRETGLKNNAELSGELLPNMYPHEDLITGQSEPKVTQSVARGNA